ncbi:MAG: PorV/PorQ family protein [Hyphomicrobiales bacterium]
MKNIYRYLVAVLLFGMISIPFDGAQAGNKDRSGQAGAPELLINPWARSAGWGNVGVANIRGLEAQWLNVAGLAHTRKTEILFNNTQWLKGSDISINSFGFAQRIGESSVLGVSVMSMGFGEIPVTTYGSPDGTGATFKPNYMNINVAYAKAFSSSIFGGFNMKIISQSISDLSATGFAIDAGIQYVTGEEENIKFGITLKNIGPTMSYSGDGLSLRAYLDKKSDLQNTLEQRAEDFELPASLSIGFGYDFLFSDRQRFTLAGTFQSNSFTQDIFIAGGEYSFKDYFMVRAGYAYEAHSTDEITNSERLVAPTGLNLGATIEIPINKETGSSFGIDYSYSDTDSFEGTHRIGVKLNF